MTRKSASVRLFHRLRNSSTLKGLLFGLAVTPVALLLAIESGGAGHGDYVIARLLYPYPVLATLLTTSAAPLVLAAVMQLPAYGWIIGYSRSRDKKWHLVLGALHLAGVVAAFSGVFEHFGFL